MGRAGCRLDLGWRHLDTDLKSRHTPDLKGEPHHVHTHGNGVAVGLLERVHVVRSTSEVYMHIAMANFYLLSVTGPKIPADLKEGMDKTVTSKPDVIIWLKRSLDAVKEAHLAETPKDLERKVHIADRDATVDGIYLRILVHANEHMGQLVAYARMTGILPPWSTK
jgi:uncharacterized damage-inducible protein DinB